MYVVRSSDEVDEQIAQLLYDGAARFAELRTALELDPWAGEAYVRADTHRATIGDGLSASSGLVEFAAHERVFIVTVDVDGTQDRDRAAQLARAVRGRV